MLAYSYAGLGQEAARRDVLDHSLVPFRSRARFLRLVKTIRHAKDYAAGGFHVSVTRGLCGGAADPASGFAGGGTRAGACVAPLGRDDIRTAWRKSAQAYLNAFNQAQQGALVDQVKQLLRTANLLADQAYGLEKVDPPRDPVTQEPETPSPKSGVGGIGLALGLAGLMGMTAYAIKRGQTAYEAGMWV
jgi:hypothetical protein